MITKQISDNIVLVWDEDTAEAKLKNLATGQAIDWNYGIDTRRMFDNLCIRYIKNYNKS